MMRRTILAVSALILGALGAPAAAGAAPDPAAVITNLGNRALEVLGNKNTSPAQRCG